MGIGSLERFLNVVAPDKDEETHQLAKDFYNTIHLGRFSWMGIGEAEDEYKMHHLSIYLAERSGSEVSKRMISVSDPFVKLSLKLHPTFLHLFYIPSGRNRPLADIAIKSISREFKSENCQPNPELVFEETIIPPVFYRNL